MPDFSSPRHLIHVNIYRIIFGFAAIFWEDFSSVASVNVRFSWMFLWFCFNLLLSTKSATLRNGYSPWQAWLVSLGALPSFQSHDFHHGCLYVESSEGGRGGLKWFVTVAAWKFLKISCCRMKQNAIGTILIQRDANTSRDILQFRPEKLWKLCLLTTCKQPPKINKHSTINGRISAVSWLKCSIWSIFCTWRENHPFSFQSKQNWLRQLWC